jgi:hypothetical protein
MSEYGGFGNEFAWPGDQQYEDNMNDVSACTFSSMPSVVSWYANSASHRPDVDFPHQHVESQQRIPQLPMHEEPSVHRPANPMYRAMPMTTEVKQPQKKIAPLPSTPNPDSPSQGDDSRKSKRERKKTELFYEAEEQDQHLSSSSGSKPKKPKPAEGKGSSVPKFWRALFDRRVPNPPANELVPPYILQMQGSLHGFYVGCPVQVDMKDGRGWQRGYVGSLKREGPVVTLADGKEVQVDFSKNVR